MKKGGIWKCDNPYSNNLKQICKKTLPNKLNFSKL